MPPIATVDTETRSGWPFLFVGAGEATYFEWAEVHVLFLAPPDPAARAAIEAEVPPPLRDSVDWNGAHLMVASDQFAHAAIAETYAEDGDPEDEEAQEGWFFAGEAAVQRFNGAIEAWLLHAHQRAPILVAYRHEDEESGGTELSPWHDWSVQQTDRLLPALEPILERADDDAQTHAARGVLEMVRESGVFLSKRVQALLDRDGEEEDDDEELIDEARAAAESPGDTESLPALARARARAHQSKPVADMLAYHGYQAIQDGEWDVAIALFELVMGAPQLELTAYNNALYAVMADNNHQPIDRPRSERFLEAALRFAPENPSIFYNAACVYWELGEVEKTLECLSSARAHGYEDPEKMRDEPMFAPLAGDPRFIAIFADL